MTANVKNSREQNLGLRFTFVQDERALQVSDLLQGFLHRKTSQSRV